jgi:predicted XRE-type DNA-binding protein
MQSKCKCGRAIHVAPYQRKAIRAFLRVYPWVAQKDVAILFNISQSRVSEIVHADVKRGGK